MIKLMKKRIRVIKFMNKTLRDSCENEVKCKITHLMKFVDLKAMSCKTEVLICLNSSFISKYFFPYSSSRKLFTIVA